MCRCEGFWRLDLTPPGAPRPSPRQGAVPTLSGSAPFWGCGAPRRVPLVSPRRRRHGSGGRPSGPRAHVRGGSLPGDAGLGKSRRALRGAHDQPQAKPAASGTALAREAAHAVRPPGQTGEGGTLFVIRTSLNGGCAHPCARRVPLLLGRRSMVPADRFARVPRSACPGAWIPLRAAAGRTSPGRRSQSSAAHPHPPAAACGSARCARAPRRRHPS